MVELSANSGDPDQMRHSAASDLGLHCLPVTHLGDSSLQWVKFPFCLMRTLPKTVNKLKLCTMLNSLYS